MPLVPLVPMAVVVVVGEDVAEEDSDVDVAIKEAAAVVEDDSSYSKEEWDALTWEQQNQVFELRRSSEGDHSTDRNVNAAASESSDSSAAQRSEVQAGRAGDAFASRKRHKPE